MNMLTTLPGAAIGSDSDVLAPKLTLEQMAHDIGMAHRVPEAMLGLRQAPRTEIRQRMAHIMHLAMDVTAAGRYIADAEYHGSVESFSVLTYLADEPCNGPSSIRHYFYLDCIGDRISVDEAHAELEAMIAHLEQLLEASA